MSNSNNQLVFEILEEGNLNWSVEKAPNTFTIGGKTYESGKYSTARVVKKDDEIVQVFPLGTVGQDYSIFQNSELAELVLEVADTHELKIHKAGFFKDGALVYVQLENGSLQVGNNNDRVENYITATNSHNGSSALNFGFSNLTISCQNTFRANQSILGKQNSIRHTAGMEKAVKDALENLAKVRELDANFSAKILRMASREVTPKEVAEALAFANRKEFAKKKFNFTNQTAIAQIEEEFHGRTSNKIVGMIESVGSEMASKGQTVWGLISGFTHYSTHKAGNDEDKRVEQKFQGHLNNFDNEMMSYGLQLLEKPTKTLVSVAQAN